MSIIRNSFKILRYIYIAGAFLYVVVGFTKTLKKAREGKIVDSIEEVDLHEHLYPSITICALFKNGNKDVLPLLWQSKWEETGKQKITAL